MADKKISQLTAITAPISGTDVLPIVQSSTTKKITVAQLVPGLGSFTAPSGNVKGLVWTDGTVLANDATVTDVGYDTSTNTVQAKNLTVASTATITNGNLVIGTSGKGIDFSATASGSGTMTSELLADYEEGTWTPVLTTDDVTPTVVFATQTGTYTKIGNIVKITGYIETTSVTGTFNGNVMITGLPYTVAQNTPVSVSLASAWSATTPLNGYLWTFQSRLMLMQRSAIGSADANVAYTALAAGASSNKIAFSATYRTT